MYAIRSYYVKISEQEASGFYLDDYQSLIRKLTKLQNHTGRIYLFGVTFALLELAREYKLDLDNLVILETGGMKGRGTELIREELHEQLMQSFRTANIYSEYGMTELLSQAYLV